MNKSVDSFAASPKTSKAVRMDYIDASEEGTLPAIDEMDANTTAGSDDSPVILLKFASESS